MNEDDTKKFLKVIQDSIFEAKSSYTIWKAIAFSRSTEIVTPSLAHKYVETQSIAPSFFVMTERMALATFVIYLLHVFDKDQRTCTFFKIDGKKTKQFITENNIVFNKLKLVRDTVFAHKNFKVNTDEIKPQIPPLDDLDEFFVRLFKFYNSFTIEKYDVVTSFDYSTDDLLDQMEFMLINMSKGHKLGILFDEFEYQWELDPKKMSEVFKTKKK